MFNSAFLLATNIIDIIIDNIMTKDFITLLIMFLIISLAVFIPIIVVHNINEKKYAELSQTVLSELGFQNWDIIPFQDLCISTKTRLLFDKYTTENFFDYELDKLEFAIQAINKKVELSNLIKNFIQNNKYQSHPQYKRLLKQLNTVLFNASHFRVYVSHTGVSRADTKSKVISITQNRIIQEKLYRELECVALKELNFPDWNVLKFYDAKATVKSRQSLEKYDDIKFFKDEPDKLEYAIKITNKKVATSVLIDNILQNNEYKIHPQFNRLKTQLDKVLYNASAFRIHVTYISQAGNNLGSKTIALPEARINLLKNDPSLLMSKGEYNKYLKELQKEALYQKQHTYYERVNSIIDKADECKSNYVIKGTAEKLDDLITQLFDRTVNSIKKIKSTDSEEWDVIDGFIERINNDTESIINNNKRIIEYYNSEDFLKIKETCQELMSSQREFNEYIIEKIDAISQLFGTRVVRNETVNEDLYEYVRPYKKTITPFTAEVSAAVFASAENNPLDYVVKNFYPNKQLYPEQIQKLQLFIQELETLREAKQIIDNYKADYKQYLNDVPSFVIENDEAGFYSRLGFAHIDEGVLTVEYKFSYTSGGGMAQRSFTVPMTEETIVELINALESKLTANYFAKEQRTLMTKKLREFIKERDHFTCCCCGNSTNAEPNLLLEIDHIIPVSKGGYTVEENLQTLCWKCNRAKSNKIII